jgi:tetratricopeptide (TPR) repeat protein
MRNRVWWLLAAVFVLKLLVFLQLKGHPLVQPDAGLDTTAYVELARRAINGDLGLGPGLYYVSPLYIYFLAAVVGLTDSFTIVRFIQIVLGTASVGFIFFTTRAWFGERAAWIAAILAALTGLFTFYEVLILQAGLDAFLTSAALYFLTVALQGTAGSKDPASMRKDTASMRKAPRVFRPGDRGAFILTGLLLGLATLNRPNMGVAVMVIAAALVLLRKTRPAVLVAAGVAAAMAPVAVRNIVVAGQWSFASSHGGLNFYIGNHAAASGSYRPVPGVAPNIVGQQRDAQRVASRALGRPVTESETSDYFFGLAWAWIREHPLQAARLFGRKLLYTFHAHHIALPYSYPFYTHEPGAILRVLAIGPWLLAPLGLAGLIFAAPRDRLAPYLVWASFVPGYGLGVAAFFVAERYRLPLLVPLAIGAGAALDLFWRAIAGRRLASIAAPAACAAVLAVPLNWPQGFQDGRWDEGLRMAERLVMLGRYQEADTWVDRLRPDAIDRGVPDYIVGRALMHQRQSAAAIAHLERAAQLDPNQPVVSYVLGQALLQAGRPGDAVPHLTRGFDGGAQVGLLGYDLALALEATGDLAGAARVIARITPGPDEDVEVWLRLGRLASGVKAPEVATRFFEHAVAMQPNQAGARQQLGLNRLLLGRVDEAARELAEAVRLDPRNADSLAHLAYCEVKLGRPDEARAHMERALAAAPDHPLALQLRSILRTRGSCP